MPLLGFLLPGEEPYGPTHDYYYLKTHEAWDEEKERDVCCCCCTSTQDYTVHHDASYQMIDIASDPNSYQGVDIFKRTETYGYKWELVYKWEYHYDWLNSEWKWGYHWTSDWVYHSDYSGYMNQGVLHPLPVVDPVEPAEYAAGGYGHTDESERILDQHQTSQKFGVPLSEEEQHRVALLEKGTNGSTDPAVSPHEYVYAGISSIFILPGFIRFAKDIKNAIAPAEGREYKKNHARHNLKFGSIGISAAALLLSAIWGVARATNSAFLDVTSHNALSLLSSALFCLGLAMSFYLIGRSLAKGQRADKRHGDALTSLITEENPHPTTENVSPEQLAKATMKQNPKYQVPDSSLIAVKLNETTGERIDQEEIGQKTQEVRADYEKHLLTIYREKKKSLGTKDPLLAFPPKRLWAATCYRYLGYRTKSPEELAAKQEIAKMQPTPKPKTIPPCPFPSSKSCT